jgi:hypothetical protein
MRGTRRERQAILSRYLFNSPLSEPAKRLLLSIFRTKKLFSSVRIVFSTRIVVLFGSYGRNHECIIKGENKYNTGVCHWKCNKCWNTSSSLIPFVLNYRMWFLFNKPLLYSVNKYDLYLHTDKCVLFLGDNCVFSRVWWSGLVNNLYLI